MAFLCFFCKEADVIEWHDVEGFDFQTSRRQSRGASASGSGSGSANLRVTSGQRRSRSASAAASGSGSANLRGSRSGQSSSPSSKKSSSVGNLEPGKLTPPRPVNKRARSVTNKGVRFMKVDIRVPKSDGHVGTKKVLRLVKIDIRSRQAQEEVGAEGEQQVDFRFISSPSGGWPFRRRHTPPRGEIQEGCETPDAGFFNSPSRDWARILSVSRPSQKTHDGPDARFFSAFQQRPARPREDDYEGSKGRFIRSPTTLWGSKHRKNRLRKEMFDKPSSSGAMSSRQSPTHEIHEGHESPDVSFLTSPSREWGPELRPNLYRRRRREAGGGSGEIKSAL